MKISFFQVGPARFAGRVLALIALISAGGLFAVVVFNEAFSFTSSNSAIYIVKKGGWFEVRRDLLLEDGNDLLFTISANRLFDQYMRALTVVLNRPMLELTWDDDEGVGGIKQYRPTGTMISLAFSRFREDGAQAKGLFLGGNLPPGDASVSHDWNTSGFGYYTGEKWVHIWCALNEGFKVYGTERTLIPTHWTYGGSRVLRRTRNEVVIESVHHSDEGGGRITMIRRIVFRAGDDYFLLRARIVNEGPVPVIYGYSVGDEPWVGSFGTSGGDVGWYEGGLVDTERFLPAGPRGFAGFWDIGNRAAGEEPVYSGFADFVEWISPQPSLVFFSNALDRCCENNAPLASRDSRVLNILWLEQMLRPQEARDHILAFGMAHFDHAARSLRKPEVAVALSLNEEE